MYSDSFFKVPVQFKLCLNRPLFRLWCGEWYPWLRYLGDRTGIYGVWRHLVTSLWWQVEFLLTAVLHWNRKRFVQRASVRLPKSNRQGVRATSFQSWNKKYRSILDIDHRKTKWLEFIFILKMLLQISKEIGGQMTTTVTFVSSCDEFASSCCNNYGWCTMHIQLS